jgi:hypothetical protein
LAFPPPEPPGSVTDLDALLSSVVHVAPADQDLYVAWLVAALVPDIPHPIIRFGGEQGSAKTTTARITVRLVDPTTVPARTAPKDESAWVAAANGSWAFALDNLSLPLPAWQSDALCCAVTGAGRITRALYTDDDVNVSAIQRVIALTTIDAAGIRGDLADRLLPLNLERISEEERLTETDIEARFQAAHSAIVSALLDVLARVLVVLPSIKLERAPRMADFAVVVAAVDRVRGTKALQRYRDLIEATMRSLVADDEFASAIERFARKLPEGQPWEGTASGLRKLLTDDGRSNQPYWPKGAPQWGNALRRCAAPLRILGVHIDFDRDQSKKRVRHITISYRPHPADAGRGDQPSASSASPHTSPDQGERTDIGTDGDTRGPGHRPHHRPAHTPSSVPISSRSDSTDGAVPSSGEHRVQRRLRTRFASWPRPKPPA